MTRRVSHQVTERPAFGHSQARLHTKTLFKRIFPISAIGIDPSLHDSTYHPPNSSNQRQKEAKFPCREMETKTNELYPLVSRRYQSCAAQGLAAGIGSLTVLTSSFFFRIPLRAGVGRSERSQPRCAPHKRNNISTGMGQMLLSSRADNVPIASVNAPAA